MKSDINQRLKKHRKELDALGPARETKDQQFKYLLELSTRFQAVTSLALRANYGTDDIFSDSSALRLATTIVQRNARFARDIKKFSHKMDFGMHEPVTADEYKKDNEEEDDSESGEDHEEGEEEQGEAQSEEDDKESVTSESGGEGDGRGGGEKWEELESPQSLSVRYRGNDTELEDILVHGEVHVKVPKRAGKIARWLKKIYETSQGFELGTFDPALLSTVWKAQSANWNAIAMGYIEDIVSLVHDFTVELLSKICQDEHIRRGINSVLLEKLMEKYKKSIDHTKFVLTVERYGTPMTNNHYFADNLEKS